MEKLILNYYESPGHGWLEVPSKIIMDNKWNDLISQWSYISKDGKTVLLEEDADADAIGPRIEKLYDIKWVNVDMKRETNLPFSLAIWPPDCNESVSDPHSDVVPKLRNYSKESLRR